MAVKFGRNLAQHNVPHIAPNVFSTIVSVGRSYAHCHCHTTEHGVPLRSAGVKSKRQLDGIRYGSGQWDFRILTHRTRDDEP